MVLAALVLSSGCAGLPRIDPSGDRFLIWPDQTQTALATQAVPSVVPAQPALPGSITGVPGNAIAPPVYSAPQAGTPVVANPLGGLPLAMAANRPVGDRVVITPSRVMAPVGTEVILRGGVCGESGYLRTNQRIEWMLGREGAGQFVTVGEQGERDFMRLPWNTPSKVDNAYAVGYTSPFHTCLNRGTPDPSDDVQVRPGDAWITVTSAAEGTSYVTAYAPGVDNWDARRASTTIYWVDAQWQFPQSTTVPAGQPHVLTTTVTRQSDGAPIAGWIVRYEVADQSGALLGYDSGQSSEVTTDSRGRARIEVSPNDGQPGVTQIRTTVIRPEQAGMAASPRVDVGSGVSSITWAAGTGGGVVVPPLQPPTSPPDVGPPTGPPFIPPTQEPPPVIPTPTGRPQLEVQIRRETADPIRVGDTVAYNVIVRNRGDGIASNILVVDRYDEGLTNAFDTSGKNQIEYDQMSPLGPGESDSVRLEFDVLEEGRRCHEVTVTADGTTEAFDRACLNAEPLEAQQPTLSVGITGERRRVVGEQTVFSALVENTGNIVAKNVVVQLFNGRGLKPTDRERELPDETFTLIPGGYQWRLPQIEPGQRKSFALACLCTEARDNACVRVSVTADGGLTRADEACVEVVPPLSPSPGDGAAGPPPGPATGLKLSLGDNANPSRVGQRGVLYAYLNNTGTGPQSQVELQLRIPREIEPDLQAIQSRVKYQTDQNRVITFEPLSELRASEQLSVLIPFDARTQGRAIISGRARSAESPEWQAIEWPIEVRPR